MKINHYVKADTIQHAFDELKHHQSNVVMGGGVWLKLTKKPIGTLIDLSDLALEGITETDDMVEIGAMTSLRDIETSPIIQGLYGGILSTASGSIMGINVRNVATIGGSVMGKYSFSDVITPLLVMNPKLVFHQNETMTLGEFLSHKGRLDDILIGIQIPKKEAVGYFNNVKKTSLDFAILNLAIAQSDTISIAVGARPGIATLANNAMEYLNKRTTWNDDSIQEAVALAVDEIPVSSNVRASAEYRKELLRIYLERGLKEVLS